MGQLGGEEPVEEEVDEFLAGLEKGLRVGRAAEDQVVATGGAVHHAGVGLVLLDL